MRKRSPALGSFAGLLLLLALAFAPRAEAALPLRSPQIVLQPAPLQGYFNGLGEAINVTTDQAYSDTWFLPFKGCDFLFTITALDPSAACTIGIYSTSQVSPTLCPLFPSVARLGWYCRLHVSASGTAGAFLFDESNTIVSITNYTGFDVSHIGLYIQGQGGTWYTEDSRNGGKAEVLAFAGIDAYYWNLFLCFERSPYDPALSTFASEVLLVQPICGDPVRKPAWGQIKALYR